MIIFVLQLLIFSAILATALAAFPSAPAPKHAPAPPSKPWSFHQLLINYPANYNPFGKRSAGFNNPTQTAYKPARIYRAERSAAMTFDPPTHDECLKIKSFAKHLCP